MRDAPNWGVNYIVIYDRKMLIQATEDKHFTSVATESMFLCSISKIK